MIYELENYDDYPEILELIDKSNEIKQKGFDDLCAFFRKYTPHDGSLEGNTSELKYSIVEDMRHTLRMNTLEDGVVVHVEMIADEISGQTFITIGQFTRNARLNFSNETIDIPADFIQYVYSTAKDFQSIKEKKNLEAHIESKKKNIIHAQESFQKSIERFLKP